MNDDFLKKVYQNIKDEFKHIDKKSWVYVDFFKNEENGYDYFKESIIGDSDFDYLKDDKYFIGKDINEIINDVADEIEDKLRENYTMSEFEQIYFETII